VVVGLTSTGGGALLTPALVLIVGIPPTIAIGSDVLIAAVMKLFGAAAYLRHGHVHLPTVLRLALGSLPGAACGVALLNLLPPGQVDAWLLRALSVVLLLAGGLTFWRLRRGAHVAPPADAARLSSTPRTALLGFVVGVLVATTSVGSGSILLAVLALYAPLPAATLVGTDIAHALLLSATAAAGHLAAGRIDPGLVLRVLAGAIPGVLIGARLAVGVPERTLRAALATLLILIGASLGLTGAPSRSHAAPSAARSHGVPR
jgi:hypothetical protein